MLKLLWSLLIVNLGISSLILQGIAYFVQNSTTIILPGDTRPSRRATIAMTCRTVAAHFWRHIRSLETKKVFHIFHFLPSDVVFGIPSSTRKDT